MYNTDRLQFRCIVCALKRTNCDRAASHKKAWSKEEIAKGKKFVLEAFGKWSASKGKGDVPDGHPPKKDNEKLKNEGKTADDG